MTSQTIQIEIRSVYGNETIYPVCEKAKALAAIAGQKTLTRNTLIQAERLGFTLQVVDRFLRSPVGEMRVAA